MDSVSTLHTSDYSYDLPTSEYSYDLPTSDYSYDLPTSDYSYDLPTSEYSYDLPTRDYSYDLSTSDYSYDLHISDRPNNLVVRPALRLPESVLDLLKCRMSLKKTSILFTYDNELRYNVRISEFFDTNEFIGITFIRRLGGYCSVLALHKSLNIDPEFYVNTKRDYYSIRLRDIIVDYLDSDPTLGITIDQFF